MKIDVRNITVLIHPNEQEVLLLKRASAKKLFPNLITGIGGKVELEKGEGKDLTEAMWRELLEETKISQGDVNNINLRLITTIQRSDEVVILLWYKGILAAIPKDLSCNEGTLKFYSFDKLSDVEYVPTARDPIQFLVRLPEADDIIYTGVYTSNLKLVLNKEI